MTKYIWSGWLVLMELDGLSSDAVLRRNTWGLDLAGQAGNVNSLESAGGIGGLLAVSQAEVGGGQAQGGVDAGDYVYFYDANGNVGQVFDPATQTVVAHYEYDPFGDVTNDLSGYSYAETNRWRFSTKQFDAATGLGYWGYRYYDPVLGRWLSRDPIGELGGLHLYVYVLNAPATYMDPDGRLVKIFCCTTCVGSVFADLGGGAAGCLWGCLEYAHGSYSTSQCFWDCIKMYGEDRMDHTDLFNLYKTVVESASCACCGLAIVLDEPTKEPKQKDWEPCDDDDLPQRYPNERCDEIMQNALDALGAQDYERFGFWMLQYDLYCRDPDPLPSGPGVPDPGEGVPVPAGLAR